MLLCGELRASGVVVGRKTRHQRSLLLPVVAIREKGKMQCCGKEKLPPTTEEDGVSLVTDVFCSSRTLAQQYQKKHHFPTR